MAAGSRQFGILSNAGGAFVATTTTLGAWGDIAGSLFFVAEATPAPPDTGDGAGLPRAPDAPEPTPAPQPAYYLRVEYTTYEFDADDIEELCSDDPTCPQCGGSGSGSGGSSGGSDTTTPGGPYTGPCTCPPGYSLFLVGLADDGVTPIYRCRNDLIGSIIRPCNEDPANGGGGGGGTGGESMTLTMELTTFDVPATTTAVSVRCVDVPACEAGCA